MENSTLCPRIVHQYDQYDADDDLNWPKNMGNSTLCPRIVHQYDQYDVDDDSVGKLLLLATMRSKLSAFT